MKGLNGQREDFERRADVLRGKLLHTIEALDQRRHTLLDLGYQARRHASGMTALGLTLAASIGVGLLIAAGRANTRRERRQRERLRALVRSFRHPERVARIARPSLPREIGRRLLVGTVTLVAMQVIRQRIRRALERPRAPSGRAPKLLLRA